MHVVRMTAKLLASRLTRGSRMTGRHTARHNQRSAVRLMYTKNQIRGQWAAHGRYLMRDSATALRPDGTASFSSAREPAQIPEVLAGWQKSGDKTNHLSGVRRALRSRTIDAGYDAGYNVDSPRSGCSLSACVGGLVWPNLHGSVSQCRTPVPVPSGTLRNSPRCRGAQWSAERHWLPMWCVNAVPRGPGFALGQIPAIAPLYASVTAGFRYIGPGVSAG
jgi:hypothetical protein